MSIARTTRTVNPSPGILLLAEELAEATRARVADLLAEKERGVPLGERPALTIAEAAQLIGVSYEHLRGYVNRGELKCVDLGSSTRRILRATLDTWLVEHERTLA